MTYLRQRISRAASPPVPTHQPFTFPASVGGVNAIDSLMMMQPQECIYTINLMPSEYGLRLRKGYREWAINCKEEPARATNQDVRTLIPFETRSRNLLNNRLFAVTAEGIWDVTNYNEQAPVQKAVFTDTSGVAGFGVWTEFTGDAAGNPAGPRGQYLYYADANNGIWVYTEETDDWARPVGWTWDDPNDPGTQDPFPVEEVAFVTLHKQRLWVILEESSDAYYLPIASIAGQLERFTFGSKMPHGGYLVGVYNWTLDGGDGVDDYLVAIGRGGDVLVYSGDDPSIIPDGSNVGPWQSRGLWYIGEIPNSRRIAGEYGPDLFILSTFGLTSMQALLQGQQGDNPSPSRNVNRFLRADIELGKTLPEWNLSMNPADGFLQIITPKPANTPYTQYNMNLQTGAWGFWEGVPMITAESWAGDYFIGGADGTVYIYDGGLDGEELLGPNAFVDDPAIPPGPEWSVVDDEYTVDGTQENNSLYTVNLAFPLEDQVLYEIVYKIKDYGGIEGAQHALFAGTEVILPYSVGDGIFIAKFLGFNNTNLSLVATPGLEATFYDVSVRRETDAGEAIKFRTLTSFQAPQGHSQNARVGLIRTVGILQGTAAVNADAVFDYKIEQLPSYPPPSEMTDPSFWDSSLWDNDVWDYVLQGESFNSGALGVGRPFAILAAGSSMTRINVVSWDVSFQAGGFL